MNEIATGIPVPNLRRLPLKPLRPDLELNNNNKVVTVSKDNDVFGEDKHNRGLKKKYNHHSSSASASGSDISVDEDIEPEVGEDNHKLQEIDNNMNGDSEKKSPSTNQETQDGIRRIRSMSDGSPNMHGYNPDGEPFEVFPSLPDSVLEKLELNGHRNNKDRLREDELEQKFVSLSLAFTIDATTIEHRCERQRRCRDQTENNLNAEIERLVEKAHRLRPLCVDAETTELFTGLLNQVDVIVQAAEHAAIAAERYGAVQHEARLAQGAQLMITHVNALKQQRDFARRQLIYTKRVLQDTSQPVSDVHKHGRHASHGNVGFHGSTSGNSRMITKRRASIATLPHQDLLNHIEPRTSEIRKITRRTSELSIRGGNILQRNLRSPRLELGLDLVKIRENSVENHHVQESTVSEEIEEDIVDETSATSFSSESHPTLEEEILEVENKACEIAQKAELCTLQFKHKVMYVLKKLWRNFGNSLTAWLDDGAQGRFFYFCALTCFIMGIISLGNVLVEMEVEHDRYFLPWL